MRARPQPNPRRGLLRAGLTVIVLIVLLLVAIGLAGAVTAPPSTAPTPPATPARITGTPTRTGTSTPKTTVTPKATPKPTVKKSAEGAESFLDQAGATMFARVHAVGVSAAASPNGRLVASFVPARDAYTDAPLLVFDRRTGRSVRVGAGDDLSYPVWSPDGRFLLYVRVRQTRTAPGALWAVEETSAAGGPSSTIARVPALNVRPLGWSHGLPLYIVALETDTMAYVAGHGAPSEVGLLAGEAVTGATLSPDGRYIAYATPTNCFFCTVFLFDTVTAQGLEGPSGMINENDMAWSSDDRLVVDLGRRLGIVSPAGRTTDVSRPLSLPRTWAHRLRVRLTSAGIRLTDDVSGTVYTSR